MTWARDDFGYEPGDVRYNGDVLAKVPPGNYPNVWLSGCMIFVTPYQARRAEIFGWRITSDCPPEIGGLVKIWRPVPE